MCLTTLALDIMFKHEYEHHKRTQSIRITATENMRQNVGFQTTFEANLKNWILRLTWIGRQRLFWFLSINQIFFISTNYNTCFGKSAKEVLCSFGYVKSVLVWIRQIHIVQSIHSKKSDSNITQPCAH